MPPNIPTSFIPKRPIDTASAVTEQKPSRVVGLLSFLTVIIVIATIVSFVGVFLYQRQLGSQKVALEQSINDARDGLGTAFVGDMKRLDARIDGVKTLLQNHIVVSPVFAALEATTLHSIQYKTFKYSFVTDPGTKSQVVQINLTGVAKSYATIALQSDAFTQSTIIRNPVFSNLTIDDKTGSVTFRLTFTVNPADLSYQTFIDSKLKAAGKTAEQMPSIPAVVDPSQPITTPQ